MARQGDGILVGTPQWALLMFRSDVLSKLILDLKRIEQERLEFDRDADCGKVRYFLWTLVDSVSGLPGGFLKVEVLRWLREFETIYQDWNNIDGDDEYAAKKRADLLESMAKTRRKKISRKIGKRQLALVTEVDFEMMSRLYGALGQLVQELPETFVQLARVHRRLLTRNVFHGGGGFRAT